MFIVNDHPPAVNPHPALAPDRLARIHDETLARLIVMHVAGDVPRERLEAAGIPALIVLEQERQRRLASQQVAS